MYPPDYQATIDGLTSGLKDAMNPRIARLSKFLSFVLRHRPDSIGITMHPQGWVFVDELIAKSHAAGTCFTREILLQVVADNDKKRFSLSTDGKMIRAAQGHSVTVDLGIPPKEPPEVLYHGTATRFVDSILTQGLKPKARQQVHLSADEATAQRVGQRHGKPAIFKVEALSMYQKGFPFFLADNGVWLVDRVPPEFLTIHTLLGAVESAKTPTPTEPST
jgi:putative RNA 2'-phosphotransferase